ncbi:hypothetical protein PGB28_06435 [Primorskyibacter aestuariivivens]|uniref:hypothetical protein n=1 Tax=Primorskyibacter aestuariivivens TaxID=1888912 RepID=UPI002301E6F9|nr:hypothetical protein [Primorskyibacter aestuariivivens]MDA7428087.1 hypothetical protein [Primorskyibacter aestuariivivens]
MTDGPPEVSGLLRHHHALMRASSPEESCHVLTEHELIATGCTVLACRTRARIVGVGAIKALDADHAELKSMHSAEEARGAGVRRALLNAL